MSHTEMRLHVTEPWVDLREISYFLILYISQPLIYLFDITAENLARVRADALFPLITAVFKHLCDLYFVF